MTLKSSTDEHIRGCAAPEWACEVSQGGEGAGTCQLLLLIVSLFLADREQLHHAAATVAPGAAAALHVPDRGRVRIVAHHHVHLHVTFHVTTTAVLDLMPGACLEGALIALKRPRHALDPDKLQAEKPQGQGNYNLAVYESIMSA